MKPKKLFWTLSVSLILSIAVFTVVHANVDGPAKLKNHKKMVTAYFELSIGSATFEVKGHGGEFSGTIDTYIEGCDGLVQISGTVSGTYTSDGTLVNVDIKVPGKADYLLNGAPLATNSSGFPPLSCYH